MKKYSNKQIYTCPMHPEIRLENPGNCPKCGMTLELMAPVESQAVEPHSEYVCPMHPEVIRSEPGACPKCGMALERRDVSMEEEENHELTDMSRRFWVSTALSMPVFILAMAHDLMPGLIAEAFFTHWLQWFEFALATPVVLWGGWPFFSARLAFRHQSQFKHVHSDRIGYWCCLGIQRSSNGCAGDFPANPTQLKRHGGCLFRSFRRHYGLGAAGASTGTKGSKPHQSGYQNVAGAGTENCAPGL